MIGTGDEVKDTMNARTYEGSKDTIKTRTSGNKYIAMLCANEEAKHRAMT